MVTMSDIYTAYAFIVDRSKGMKDEGELQLKQMSVHDELGRVIAKEAGYDVTPPLDRTVEDIHVNGTPCDIKIDFRTGWIKSTGNVFVETISNGKRSKSHNYPLLLYIYANDITPIIIRCVLINADYLRKNLKSYPEVFSSVSECYGILIQWEELEKNYALDVRLVDIKRERCTKMYIDGQLREVII